MTKQSRPVEPCDPPATTPGTDERDAPVDPEAGPASLGVADAPIGPALRLLRQGEGLKQNELTRRGGPDCATISHWENGRKIPSLKLLLRYLDALGLSLRDLQDAFDHLAGRPRNLANRVTEFERRLCVVERAMSGSRG